MKYAILGVLGAVSGLKISNQIEQPKPQSLAQEGDFVTQEVPDNGQCDSYLNRLVNEQNGNLESTPTDFTDLSFNGDNNGLWICPYVKPYVNYQDLTSIVDSSTLNFWNSGIKPDHFRGGLSCTDGFFSSMAALAQWPERIRSIFAGDYTSFPANGKIQGTFYYRGQPRTVTVDDSFPFRQCNGRYYLYSRDSTSFGWYPAFLRKLTSKFY